MRERFCHSREAFQVPDLDMLVWTQDVTHLVSHISFRWFSCVPADPYIGRLGRRVVVRFLRGPAERPTAATVAIRGRRIEDVHGQIVAYAFDCPRDRSQWI